MAHRVTLYRRYTHALTCACRVPGRKSEDISIGRAIIREPYTGKHFVGGSYRAANGRGSPRTYFARPCRKVGPEHGVDVEWKMEDGERRSCEGLRRRRIRVVSYTRAYVRVRVKRINYNDGGRTETGGRTVGLREEDGEKSNGTCDGFVVLRHVARSACVYVYV